MLMPDQNKFSYPAQTKPSCNNLSHVSLPALVLLGEGVLLKQFSLVGEAPSICLIQDRCYGYCCGVTLLRDVRHRGGAAIQLTLRDCGQQGPGVR